jgi:hypothetical protein
MLRHKASAMYAPAAQGVRPAGTRPRHKASALQARTRDTRRPTCRHAPTTQGVRPAGTHPRHKASDLQARTRDTRRPPCMLRHKSSAKYAHATQGVRPAGTRPRHKASAMYAYDIRRLPCTHMRHKAPALQARARDTRRPPCRHAPPTQGARHVCCDTRRGPWYAHATQGVRPAGARPRHKASALQAREAGRSYARSVGWRALLAQSSGASSWQAARRYEGDAGATDQCSS